MLYIQLRKWGKTRIAAQCILNEQQYWYKNILVPIYPCAIRLSALGSFNIPDSFKKACVRHHLISLWKQKKLNTLKSGETVIAQYFHLQGIKYWNISIVLNF